LLLLLLPLLLLLLLTVMRVQVMVQNVERLLERGEKIELLVPAPALAAPRHFNLDPPPRLSQVNRAESLTEQSVMFHKNSTNLKRKM
jgi:hypothetical protein